MRDIVISGVRTAVQAFVGFIAAYFAGLGIVVDSNALELGLTSIVVGIATILLNALATKFPIISKVNSLGISESTPVYED